MKTQYKSGDIISINVVIIDNDVPKQAIADAIVREVFSSEILSIEVFSISKEKATGIMYITPDRIIKPVGNCTEETQSNSHGSDTGRSITWARRTSDDQKFFLGEPITVGQITGIEVDKMYAGGIKFNINNEPDYWVAIEVAEKVQARKKLFTTEDGVDIYQGDKCWHVDKHFGLHECPGAGSEKSPNKRFSTIDAAREYLIRNKPCLSLSDIDEWNKDNFFAALDGKAGPTLKSIVSKKLGL